MAMPNIKPLLTSQRGTSAIEFAFVAPLLALLLLGLIDIALAVSTKLELKQAAIRSIELASLKGTSSGTFNYLIQEAATASGRPTSDVTVDSWLECSHVRQASYSGECLSSDQVARYVSVTINGTYDPIFDYGPLAALYGGQGLGDQLAMSGTAAVRVQ